MRPPLLAALALLLAPAAAAQTGAFLPYVGYNVETENVVVGVGTRLAFPIASPLQLSVQPGVEVQFPDDVDLTILQADLNLLLDVPSPAASPYVGAGAGLLYVDGPGGSETEPVFNVVAGVTLNPIGFVQPFAQGRYTTGDDYDAVTVMGGVALGI